MPIKLSKSETAQLRELAAEAWETELRVALEALFEDFGRWADHEYSSFELSDRIHDFHDGLSRELYKRYAGLPPLVAVARAIAVGAMDEAALSPSLREKLKDEIDAMRKLNDAD